MRSTFRSSLFHFLITPKAMASPPASMIFCRKLSKEWGRCTNEHPADITGAFVNWIGSGSFFILCFPGAGCRSDGGNGSCGNRSGDRCSERDHAARNHCACRSAGIGRNNCTGRNSGDDSTCRNGRTHRTNRSGRSCRTYGPCGNYRADRSHRTCRNHHSCGGHGAASRNCT